MYKFTNVGARPGGEAFLLETDKRTALIDSGFSFCAGETVDNLKKALSGKRLDYVLLTHSHYDHAGGAPYVKRAFPDTIVIAGEYASKIFERPGAKALIKEMNDSAALRCGISKYEDLTSSITVDRTVKEGDVIDMGDFSLRVIETPGHTKCSISFYSDSEKLLIAAETLGVPCGDDVISPCCLVGYDMTIESIKKAQKLGAESILFPHYKLVSGKAAADKFFTDSLFWHEKAKKTLNDAKVNGSDENELCDILKQMFYTEEAKRIQPEKAFYLNAGYIIKCMLGVR